MLKEELLTPFQNKQRFCVEHKLQTCINFPLDKTGANLFASRNGGRVFECCKLNWYLMKL